MPPPPRRSARPSPEPTARGLRAGGGPAGLGYGPPDGGERLNLFLVTEPGVRLAAGPRFHLALDAPDRDAVHAFHDAGIANGGTSYGEPGLREHYSPTCYAAFVRDPDDHKLEVVHQ